MQFLQRYNHAKAAPAPDELYRKSCAMFSTQLSVVETCAQGPAV